MVALGVAVPIVAGVVTLPVRSVQISGEFVRVSEADIERAVAPQLVSGLFRVDVEALRRAALAVPGVREATVRRVRSDRVEIFVIERVAVARWAGGGFIEVDGTHFSPADGGGSAEALPLLTGPEGSHQRVLDLHAALERGARAARHDAGRHRAHRAGRAVRDARWRSAPGHAARSGRKRGGGPGRGCSPRSWPDVSMKSSVSISATPAASPCA